MKKVEKTTEKISSKKHLPILKEKLKRKYYREALQIIQKLKLSGYTLTKSRLKDDYQLSNEQIQKLHYIEVPSPYFKKSAPMKLFLIQEIENIVVPIKKTK